MRNLEDYIYLKDLVADCGGIEKFRFFGHLNKYSMMTPFGFVFSDVGEQGLQKSVGSLQLFYGSQNALL